MGCAAPHPQPLPGLDEPDVREGLLCICGPLANKLRAWDRTPDACMMVEDPDRPWEKHLYVYTRLALTEGKDVVGYAQFWAYAGSEGM